MNNKKGLRALEQSLNKALSYPGAAFSDYPASYDKCSLCKFAKVKSKDDPCGACPLFQYISSGSNSSCADLIFTKKN